MNDLCANRKYNRSGAPATVCPLLSLVSSQANWRLWSHSLQQYLFTVVHWAGSANGNADALSRIDDAGTGAVQQSQEKGEGMWKTTHASTIIVIIIFYFIITPSYILNQTFHWTYLLVTNMFISVSRTIKDTCTQYSNIPVQIHNLLLVSLVSASTSLRRSPYYSDLKSIANWMDTLNLVEN